MVAKIYTVPDCAWCTKAKTWLKNNNISFQELDTSEVEDYRDQLIQKTGQLSVPVIELEQKTIVGYHEDQMRDAFRHPA